MNPTCDNCGTERELKYQDYYLITNKLSDLYYCNKCVKNKKTKFTLIKKYGVNNVSKSDLIKERKKNTNIKNWGVENVFQSETIKSKLRETFLLKYGVEHFRQNEYIKEREKQLRIKYGTQMPDDKLSDYEKYRKKVRRYTYKYKKELYNNWNGLDYYDGENILKYKKLNYNSDLYPHVDHKISIFYGFKNNIDPSIIGYIDNLCITKRINNLSKGNLFNYPKRLKNKE